MPMMPMLPANETMVVLPFLLKRFLMERLSAVKKLMLVLPIAFCGV